MADSDKEMTYSDDEFGSDGSDYEAEFEEHEAESEVAQAVEEELPTREQDATPIVADANAAADSEEPEVGRGAFQEHPAVDRSDDEVEESIGAKPAEPTPKERYSADPGGSAGNEEADRVESPGSVTTAPPSELTTEPDTAAERIEPIVPLSETRETSVASTEEHPEEEESVDNRPRLLGQFAKPASARSLSVPVVPAASLVDPSLLVPSNLRSTSVPVVPSNEIIGIHRENSGRFRIETMTRNTARHRSIVRLPSVEEFEAQDAVESDEESDSESDDADDSRAATPPFNGGLPRGRSSSFQLNQTKTSPVLRAKSQPFMLRLPSVIEVTAEEILMIESMHDSDDDAKSDGEKNSTFVEEETGRSEWKRDVKLGIPQDVPPVSCTSTELETPKAEASPDSSELDGTEAAASVEPQHIGALPAESDLQAETASLLEPAQVAIYSESSQESSEPGDEYEDDYDDQRQSDTAEQVATEGNDVDDTKTADNQEMPSELDEFNSVEDVDYNDDEYEGENEEFPDLQFEEENRRETELLLREAQMLIQKQHKNESDRMLLSALKSESPDIPDQCELPDNSEPTILPPAGFEDIEEVITSTRASSTTVPNFEDQYGGDDEFVNAEEDDDGEDFDQYGSDHDDANDVDEAWGLEKPSLERKPSEHAIQGESTSVSAVESPASEGNSELVMSPVTDTQADNSQPEASQIENTHQSEPVGSTQHGANGDMIPSENPKETEQVEKSEPAANGTTNSVKLQQKSKPTAKPDTAAQKPTRVLSTRPSRPIAAAAPNATEPRATRPARPTTERRKVEIAESVLKRERPRELRSKSERSGAQSTPTQPSSHGTPPPRSAQTRSEENKAKEAVIDSVSLEPSSVPPAQATPAEAEASNSPERDARRSPERIPAYTPRVYVEEYKPPPPKAPVFTQKRVKKPRTEDSRRKLQPVKSPPNLRIALPSMDKTKRDWLFLNMFRHGDDVSKYESFVPKLVSPCLTQAAGRPMRPHSASQQTYASSQAEAIAGYGDGRRSRNGRKLVQQDPALREREQNWMPIKPHESAIPAYDSILDKFCTTVTSPVIQRQIYQTRHDDLSPQLAYVLEKRVEKQWKNGAAEAFGSVSLSYKTDVVQSPSNTDKKSPSKGCSTSPSM